MHRTVRRYWKSRFAQLVQGYVVECLTKRLDVRPSAAPLPPKTRYGDRRREALYTCHSKGQCQGQIGLTS
jgi:hypothetical protein